MNCVFYIYTGLSVRTLSHSQQRRAPLGGEDEVLNQTYADSSFFLMRIIELSIPKKSIHDLSNFFVFNGFCMCDIPGQLVHVYTIGISL